ncbi:MAG: formylglycine-generating enzyme family protein [Candidatus Poribacteria bacterium]|nr:formylglycine-generating enzyme family protein [Candidatus Poribacteria bacterium]
MFTERLLVMVNETDGSEMVLIPSGSYLMGSPPAQTTALIDKDARLSTDFFHLEHPQHPVSLPAFYIDRSPVTNAQYAAFIAATGHPIPKYWTHTPHMGVESPFPVGVKHGTHPVVGVSYADALAYCEWAGKRLPTEAEWEKAARGGLVNQNYPWGNESSRDYANTAGIWGKDRWLWTSPIGSFPPNGYGLSDMAGNVFEWCADWYAPDYYQHSQEENPHGPKTGQTRVLRGGSWSNNVFGIYQMRCAYRFHARPETRNLTIGFRCAADPPP